MMATSKGNEVVQQKVAKIVTLACQKLLLLMDGCDPDKFLHCLLYMTGTHALEVMLKGLVLLPDLSEMLPQFSLRISSKRAVVMDSGIMSKAIEVFMHDLFTVKINTNGDVEDISGFGATITLLALNFLGVLPPRYTSAVDVHEAVRSYISQQSWKSDFDLSLLGLGSREKVKPIPRESLRWSVTVSLFTWFASSNLNMRNNHTTNSSKKKSSNNTKETWDAFAMRRLGELWAGTYGSETVSRGESKRRKKEVVVGKNDDVNVEEIDDVNTSQDSSVLNLSSISATSLMHKPSKGSGVVVVRTHSQEENMGISLPLASHTLVSGLLATNTASLTSDPVRQSGYAPPPETCNLSVPSQTTQGSRLGMTPNANESGGTLPSQSRMAGAPGGFAGTSSLRKDDVVGHTGSTILEESMRRLGLLDNLLLPTAESWRKGGTQHFDLMEEKLGHLLYKGLNKIELRRMHNNFKEGVGNFKSQAQRYMETCVRLLQKTTSSTPPYYSIVLNNNSQSTGMINESTLSTYIWRSLYKVIVYMMVRSEPYVIDASGQGGLMGCVNGLVGELQKLFLKDMSASMILEYIRMIGLGWDDENDAPCLMPFDGLNDDLSAVLFLQKMVICACRGELQSYAVSSKSNECLLPVYGTWHEALINGNLQMVPAAIQVISMLSIVRAREDGKSAESQEVQVDVTEFNLNGILNVGVGIQYVEQKRFVELYEWVRNQCYKEMIGLYGVSDTISRLIGGEYFISSSISKKKLKGLNQCDLAFSFRTGIGLVYNENDVNSEIYEELKDISNEKGYWEKHQKLGRLLCLLHLMSQTSRTGELGTPKIIGSREDKFRSSLSYKPGMTYEKNGNEEAPTYIGFLTSRNYKNHGIMGKYGPQLLTRYLTPDEALLFFLNNAFRKTVLKLRMGWLKQAGLTEHLNVNNSDLPNNMFVMSVAKKAGISTKSLIDDVILEGLSSKGIGAKFDSNAIRKFRAVVGDFASKKEAVLDEEASLQATKARVSDGHSMRTKHQHYLRTGIMRPEGDDTSQYKSESVQVCSLRENEMLGLANCFVGPENRNERVIMTDDMLREIPILSASYMSLTTEEKILTRQRLKTWICEESGGIQILKQTVSRLNGSVGTLKISNEILEGLVNIFLGRKNMLVVLPCGGFKSTLYRFPAYVCQLGKIRKSVLLISPFALHKENAFMGSALSGLDCVILETATVMDVLTRSNNVGMLAPHSLIIATVDQVINLKMFHNAGFVNSLYLVAFDEAHEGVLATSYRDVMEQLSSDLKILAKRVGDRAIPVLGLTGTANLEMMEKLEEKFVNVGGQSCDTLRVTPDSQVFNANMSYYVVTVDDKTARNQYVLDVLAVLLSLNDHGTVLIVCGTKVEVNVMALMLTAKGILNLATHSELRGESETNVEAVTDWVERAANSPRVLVSTPFVDGIDGIFVLGTVVLDAPTLAQLYQGLHRSGRRRKFVGYSCVIVTRHVVSPFASENEGSISSLEGYAAVKNFMLGAGCIRRRLTKSCTSFSGVECCNCTALAEEYNVSKEEGDVDFQICGVCNPNFTWKSLLKSEKQKSSHEMITSRMNDLDSVVRVNGSVSAVTASSGSVYRNVSSRGDFVGEIMVKEVLAECNTPHCIVCRSTDCVALAASSKRSMASPCIAFPVVVSKPGVQSPCVVCFGSHITKVCVMKGSGIADDLGLKSASKSLQLNLHDKCFLPTCSLSKCVNSGRYQSFASKSFCGFNDYSRRDKLVIILGLFKRIDALSKMLRLKWKDYEMTVPPTSAADDSDWRMWALVRRGRRDDDSMWVLNLHLLLNMWGKEVREKSEEFDWWKRKKMLELREDGLIYK